MQKSARILGRKFGLNAEEMNRVLVRNGFLDGTPGNYTPTDKALPYVEEKDFHRGNGGYAFYNRYWTTLTYDDSILDNMVIDEQTIEEVREEVSAARAERRAERETESEYAKTNVSDNGDNDDCYSEFDEIVKLDNSVNWQKAGLIVLAVCAVGYVVYKVTPKIKQWWHDKQQAKEESDAKEKR